MELKNNESINKTNTNSSHLGKDGKPKKPIKKEKNPLKEKEEKTNCIVNNFDVKIQNKIGYCHNH